MHNVLEGEKKKKQHSTLLIPSTFTVYIFLQGIFYSSMHIALILLGALINIYLR